MRVLPAVCVTRVTCAQAPTVRCLLHGRSVLPPEWVCDGVDPMRRPDIPILFDPILGSAVVVANVLIVLAITLATNTVAMTAAIVRWHVFTGSVTIAVWRSEHTSKSAYRAPTTCLTLFQRTLSPRRSLIRC